MALVELEGIGQCFDGKHILQNVNVSIGKGEVFALIGPTGAGKTTLLRLIDLIDLPYSGSIRFDGIDVTREKGKRLEVRRRIAYVQQKPAVFDTSLFDNVAMPLKWRRVPRKEIRRRVEQALDLVGLIDYQKRNARTLSGGETQRVAIARALVARPELLLLDEPTANLDPVTTTKIEKVLERIIREKQTTIIMSTHDMSLGQRLAQKIGVLMDGELTQTGQKGDIFRRPRNLKVAGLVGMDNMIKGSIISSEEGSVSIEVEGKTIEGISERTAGEEVFLGIRPEDITLSLTQTSTSARNVFEGSITFITHSMPFATVEIDCGFPLVALITVRSLREMGLEVGTRLYASFKATSIHIVGG